MIKRSSKKFIDNLLNKNSNWKVLDIGCGYTAHKNATVICDVQDLAGDGNHYSATITSSSFSGKSKIEQHKMVYNSLKGKMGNELHALAIKTKEQ